MRPIVVIGNCQANALADRLRRAYADIEDVTVEWVSSFRDVPPNKIETIKNAWTICAQVTDFKGGNLESVYAGTRPIVYYPVLSISALWPASIRPRPNDEPTEFFRRGMFPGAQYCDDKANQIIVKGLGAQEAYEEFMALDYSKLFRLDRLYEMNKAKLSNLSKQSGFPAWDIYDKYFTSKRLHHTNMHPTNFLLDQVAEHLLDRIDLPASSREQWQAPWESLNRQMVIISPNGGNFTAIYQMPIHPDVVNFFGLSWYDDRNSFYYEGDISFRDYMWKYISKEVNLDIQHGVKHIAAANFKDGIDLLERGLENSPDAHNAWFVLGKVNWALQKKPEALFALGRATAVRPDKVEYANALEAVRADAQLDIGAHVDDVVFAGKAVDPLLKDAVVID